VLPILISFPLTNESRNADPQGQRDENPSLLRLALDVMISRRALLKMTQEEPQVE
jgi:hypothetical protein